MATAPHPQTLIVFTPVDDILPTRHGDRFEIWISTKIGFKKHKSVMVLYVTNQ